MAAPRPVLPMLRVVATAASGATFDGPPADAHTVLPAGVHPALGYDPDREEAPALVVVAEGASRAEWRVATRRE